MLESYLNVATRRLTRTLFPGARPVAFQDEMIDADSAA